jgi:hypothetical protein
VVPLSASTPFGWASLAIDSNRCLRAAKALSFSRRRRYRHRRSRGEGASQPSVMQKIKARSLPALSRMADKLKLAPDEPQQF